MSIAMKAMITIGMVLGVFAIVIFLSGLVVGFGWAVLGWVGLVVLVLLLAGVLPVMTSGLASRPDPSKSYNESMLRFQAAAAHPEAPVLSICEPQLLVHGRKTDKVFVLIHGLSNCPYSFSEWAPDLHAAGHNVLAPRMPYNGHKDNTTDALRHTTARELADFCDHCIDVAAGLGHEVIVIGISGGGILAGWIAQNRPEVTRAVLVAPAFGLAEFGVSPNAFLMRLMLLLPHISVWKDPILRAGGVSRAHSYKRQSTHGMGEYMRLGLAVRRQAHKNKPAAGSIVVVTNADDDSVDHYVTFETADIWKSDGADLTRFEFPKDAHLPHEMIDPSEPGAVPSLVYPALTALAERRPVPSSAPQEVVR